MDNDDAPVGRVWSRRDAMRLGLGALVGGLAGCATSDRTTTVQGTRQPLAAASTRPSLATTRPLVATPALTEGPFFVDERLTRSDLIGDTTRRSVVDAAPLSLDLVVLKLSATGIAEPLAGAVVDVWHSDAVGVYSDENNPMNGQDTAGQRWLRGNQTTDAAGRVRFTTIVPGWYDGRTPHVHFKVRQFDAGRQKTAEFTSQWFLHEQTLDRIYLAPPYTGRGARPVRNSDDDIYNQPLPDGSVAGDHQLLTLWPRSSGYAAGFTIILTDASLHAGPTNDGPMNGGPPDDFGGPPMPF